MAPADQDRKFQQELDRVIKKIDKGHEYFSQMWPKLEAADPVRSSSS